MGEPEFDSPEGTVRSRSLAGIRVSDLLFGLLALVAIQIELLVSGAWAPEQAAYPVIIAVAVTVRRRHPFATLALTLLPVPLADQLVPAWSPDAALELFAILFLAYTYAFESGSRGWRLLGEWVVLAALAGLGTGGDEQGSLTMAGILAGAGFSFLAPAIVGRFVRGRTALGRELAARNRELLDRRKAAAENAVFDERERIAAELHDLVAHELNAMVVQAGAARRQLHTDPARCREGFEAIEVTGREALGEMRRMLGALRREDDAISLAPQPTLERIGGLVERHREAGLPVELQIETDYESMSRGAELAAYRMVQEGLAMLLVADAGWARVVLGHDGLALRLAVEGPVELFGEQRGGAELAGIRRRIELHHGELVLAGRRLEASLPSDASTAVSERMGT